MLGSLRVLCCRGQAVGAFSACSKGWQLSLRLLKTYDIS